MKRPLHALLIAALGAVVALGPALAPSEVRSQDTPRSSGSASAPLPTDLPPLALPIRCPPGKQCMVQFYPDADPGSDFRDHRCGRTTRDRHTGTDIRVPSMADVRRGVPVLAAISGTVVAVRDGEPDIDITLRGRDEVNKAGKGGGNAVVLRHGEGWTSHYLHLRAGSVRVERDQRVAGGETLGLVGLSGNTNFPHLHFEVRYRNRAVDPFTGTQPHVAGKCGLGGRSLWSGDAAAAFAWREITLVEAGFSDRTPYRPTMEDEDPPRLLLIESPILAFWWELAGVEAGDRTEVRIVGPNGRNLAERKRGYDRPQSFVFDFIGRSAGGQLWPAGLYSATLQHHRGERLILKETRRIELR